MIKHYSLKFFAALLLLLIICPDLRSQSFQNPIAGSIYGQAIVACTGANDLYEFAATDVAVYARRGNKTDYYANVWTAPGDLQITSFSVQHKNGNHYRSILLHDGDGNFYVVYNKIKAPAPDSTITGPVLLPVPFSGKYTKIVAGDGLYVYSFLSGGPPGNITVSRDNGLTWQPDTMNIGYDEVFDLAVDTANNVFSVGSSGIYKQLPTDSAWTQLNTNPNSAVKIFIDQQGRIVTGGYPASLYISANGGATFNIDNSNITGQVQYFAGDAFGNLYAFSGGHLWRNSGGTGVWTDIQSGLNNALGTGFGSNCISGDSVITVGTNYGMFTSSDSGITWTATNNGIHAEDIFSIITQPNGRLLCTTDLGIFYKDAADTLWHPTSPITNFYPGNLLFNDKAGNIFVAVSPTFGNPYPLGKSIDNGLSFAIDSAGFSAIGGAGFYIDETGARHFYNYYATSANPLTVWTAQLGSSTFSLDTAGMPVFPIFGTGVKDMCSDQQGYLYASVDMPGGDMIYRRPITGSAWVPDTVGLGASSIIAPMASNYAFGIIVARGMQLYHRVANGWVLLPQLYALGDPAMLNSGINALSFDPSGVIYAAAANYSTPDSNAVFLAKDNWQLAGLVGRNMQGLVSTGDTTYALTFGNWGYVINDNRTTGIRSLPETKTGIRVFPNPSASGIWNIQTGNEWIGSQLEVYDVTGKIVYRKILNDSKTQISAPGLASGVYLLQIYNATNGVNGYLVK